MRATATGVSPRPDRRLSPWPIQGPEVGTTTSASEHRKRQNLHGSRYCPVDDNTLFVGAFVVRRTRALVHRASALWSDHDDNAILTASLDVIADALYAGDVLGSKKVILASSTNNCRKSSDRPNPIFGRIHPIYHTVLDHSSARTALTIRPTNSGDHRGFLLVASLVQNTWRADCVRPKPGSAPSRNTHQRRRWSTTLTLASNKVDRGGEEGDA